MGHFANIKTFSAVLFIFTSLALGETIVFKLYAGCPGCLPCSVSGNTLSCNCFSASVSVSGSSAKYNRTNYNYSRALSADSSKLSKCWMETLYSEEYSGNCYAIACDFDSIGVSSSTPNSSSSEAASSSSVDNSSSSSSEEQPSSSSENPSSSSSEEFSSSSSELNEECYESYDEASSIYDSRIDQCIREWNIPNFKLNSDSNCVSGECELRSSSSEESSNSSCGENNRGADAVYAEGDCFSDGLDNMEEGKCYGLNPDRGVQRGWINNNAQDSWWWVETPCDGSKPVEETTSGGCRENKRGEKAVYEIGDCFYSGLDNMEPGKCYSINPARGRQTGWINNNAKDAWWWIEAPCGEETESNECPDNGIILNKQLLSKEAESSNETISNEIWKSKTKVFYDALGRKTQAYRETRRALYVNKKYSDLNIKRNGYSESGLLKIMPDGDECGILKKDYGIVLENNQRKGGITCLWIGVNYNYEEEPIKDTLEDVDCICKNKSILLKINGNFSYNLNLGVNEIFHVKEGYIFSDGYKTTKEAEIAIKNHELKHQQDNESIIKGVSGIIPIDTAICYNKLSSFRKEIREKLFSEVKIEYRAKARAAADYFHQKCYLEGFCE